jgi:hypothetical protein
MDIYRISTIIFPSCLASSQNSCENSSRTCLATYFREQEKVPVLVSNYGNYKNDELLLKKRNSRPEKERKKLGRMDRWTDGWTDGWTNEREIDKQI